MSQRYCHAMKRADGVKSPSQRVAVLMGVVGSVRLGPHVYAVRGQRLTNGFQSDKRVKHVMNAVKAADQIVLAIVGNFVGRRGDEFHVGSASFRSQAP